MTNRKVLFTNAKLWQPDGRFDRSFGIAGSKVDFVGTDAQARQLKPNYESVIDLNGRLVLPGLTDGHLHLYYGSLMQKRLDGRNIDTIDSLKSEIERYSRANPADDWIIGGNINLNVILKDFDTGKGNFVDKLFSAKPLYIANYDYHSALCNSLALEQSGILAKITEFSDSEVVKDINGSPAGIVKENALDFVYDNMPNPPVEQGCRAIEDFIAKLHSYGITSVTDISLIPHLEVYKTMYRNKKLRLRLNSYIPLEEFENLEKHKQETSEIDPALFAIKGFKAFYDGALGSETALFSSNYKGRNHNGYKTDYVTSGALPRLSSEIDKQGGQLIIHAIGDLAVTEVLDLFESLIRQNGKRDSRHRIEHAQHIAGADIRRFKKLDIIASVQPLHLNYDMAIVKEKLPEELVDTTHNYRKLIDTGAIVNFGTDFPIVEVNPYETIRMAITRNAGGDVFTPENTITLHDCIRSYTINDAYSNFNELAAGSVEPGKFADFVIMEDNLFEMNAEEINQAKVWQTYFNGELVYQG